MKARKLFYKNDGATGYININSIDKIERHETEILICLKNNHKILCLSSFETVNKHIQNGRVVEKIMKNNDGYSYIVKESYCFYDEYDKLATKEGIALLRQELIDIRRG